MGCISVIEKRTEKPGNDNKSQLEQGIVLRKPEDNPQPVPS